jgi:hypothetical protein
MPSYSGGKEIGYTDDQYSGDTGIHSVQNGLLLTANTHLLFDRYLLAINPHVRITEVLFTSSY